MFLRISLALLASGHALHVADDPAPAAQALASDWPTVQVFAFDTRGDKEINNNGLIVKNVGHGKTWELMRTKTCGIAEHMRKLANQNHTDPVVMIDGHDVFWGGCAERDLLSTYNSLVSATGSRVVFGAEAALFPADVTHLRQYDQLADKRLKVMKALMVNEPKANSFVKCEYPKRIEKHMANPCNTHAAKARTYLNSGFSMGPPADIAPMYESACSQMNENSHSEQAVLHPYLLSHSNDITLDYTGKLVANMHNVLPEVWDRMFRVLRKDNEYRILNKEFGAQRPQCFVHGNGNGITWMKQFLNIG